MGERMTQQNQWESSLYKGCGTAKEEDTFYVFDYTNKVMSKKKEKIFGSVFAILLYREIDDKVKELVY